MSKLCSEQESVCSGMGGRGLEDLLGVCGGLLPLYTACGSDRMCLSSDGLGVEGSGMQDREK